MQVHTQHYDAKMFLIIDKVTYLAVLVHIILIAIFTFYNLIDLAILNIFSTLAWLYGRDLNNDGNQPMAIIFLSAEAIIHAIFAVAILGWQSGFQYYLLTALIFNLFRHNITLTQTLGLITIFLGTFTTLHFFTADETYTKLTPFMYDFIFYANMLIALTVMCFITYTFNQATTDAETTITQRANTDYLTGLHTRRSFSDDVDGDIKRSLINKKDSVVIMADIDHFKSINDTYGHDSGDKVLKEIAQRLKENLRFCDKVYRWGGEEFLIVLTNISLEDAKQVAQTLREDVQAATFIFNDIEVHITMTFGIAPLNEKHPDINTVIKQADSALYKGKQNGRNCIILADQDRFKTVNCSHRQTLTSHAILSGI
ncbi:MAG TPA: GGDEF domain-containing protein [Helicobacteraceae bacterium]|nr:GGDEF domain-containing protein [Helicobacteraceae bacterium]